MPIQMQLRAERDVVESLEARAEEYERQLELGVLSKARASKVRFFLERVLVRLEQHRAVVEQLEDEAGCDSDLLSSLARAGLLQGARLA